MMWYDLEFLLIDLALTISNVDNHFGQSSQMASTAWSWLHESWELRKICFQLGKGNEVIYWGLSQLVYVESHRNSNSIDLFSFKFIQTPTHMTLLINVQQSFLRLPISHHHHPPLSPLLHPTTSTMIPWQTGVKDRSLKTEQCPNFNPSEVRVVSLLTIFLLCRSCPSIRDNADEISGLGPHGMSLSTLLSYLTWYA